jgi:hypothetical protein
MNNKKVFTTPSELGLTPIDGLNRTVGFVQDKINKRELQFEVGYTQRQYTVQIKNALAESNWRLDEVTDGKTTNWKLTPIG